MLRGRLIAPCLRSNVVGIVTEHSLPRKASEGARFDRRSATAQIESGGREHGTCRFSHFIADRRRCSAPISVGSAPSLPSPLNPLSHRLPSDAHAPAFALDLPVGWLCKLPSPLGEKHKDRLSPHSSFTFIGFFGFSLLPSVTVIPGRQKWNDWKVVVSIRHASSSSHFSVPAVSYTAAERVPQQPCVAQICKELGGGAPLKPGFYTRWPQGSRLT
jgi:hypothetical protein